MGQMSRSGYSEDCDDYLAMGRAIAVRNKAMRGKRGRAFLAELLAVLDAMPVKELIREELVEGAGPMQQLRAATVQTLEMVVYLVELVLLDTL